ncbi:MAG: metal-dependent hydrolase [Myxococcota bacterium]
MGHSTFSIKTPEGETILVDPWLGSNPSCPEEFHEVASNAILITHGHFDHIGDVFTAHTRCEGSIVGIYDLTSWLGSKGVPSDKLVGMNKGGTLKVPSLKDVKVSMTDARHSSSFTEEDGTVVYLGDAAGYVVHFSSTTLYIAGDTSIFGDMALIGELYNPDVAILPIGDRFTMDPRQAAMACKMLGVTSVIPCHYDTFSILTGTPEGFKAELDKLGVEVEVLLTNPGGTIV